MKHHEAFWLALFIAMLAIACAGHLGPFEIKTPVNAPIKMLAGVATPVCVNNLCWFDLAKAKWATEHHKGFQDVPTWADIRPYLPGNILYPPACPLGGTYTLGRLGEPPACSAGGPDHTFP